MHVKTILAIAGMAVIAGCAGCAGGGDKYDVLDQVADTTTQPTPTPTPEPTATPTVTPIEAPAATITPASTEPQTPEATDVPTPAESPAATETPAATPAADAVMPSERPAYDASKYVDVSKCDLSKIEVKTVSMTVSEIDEVVREQMMSRGIYGSSDTVDENSVIQMDYTVTKDGENKPYIDVTDEECIISQNAFPEEVSKKLIGKKKGEKIKVTCDGATYNITVTKILSMELTDELAHKLDENVNTVEEYREVIRTFREYNANQQAASDALDKALKLCKVKSYPDDVLNYDIQSEYIKFYTTAESEGYDSLTEYIKTLGYSDDKDFAKQLKDVVTENLEIEMKTLALAKKYKIETENMELSDIRTNLEKELKNDGQQLHEK